MPATGLPAVADPQRQQLPMPVKIRALQLAIGGMQLAEARQSGEQVSRSAQHLLQVFRGVRRHLAAKSARRHIEKHLATHFPQVDRLRRHVQQRECLSRYQETPAARAKSLAVPNGSSTRLA